MSDEEQGGGGGGSSSGRARRASRAKLERRTGGALTLDRPVAEQRQAFARLLELTQIGMPAHTHAPALVGGIPCLRLQPTNPQRSSARTIVYVHGGGYVMGSPETHRPLAARIAHRVGAPVLMPRYRLAPEHPCPAGLEDVLAVWRGLPEGVREAAILAGDSAGGGLALALVMALRDAGEVLPAGLVLLSPWTDLTMSGASIDAMAEREVMLQRPGLELMAGRYAGALARVDPRVSPLFGRFEGLAPMLIQAGGHEVLLDDARRVAEAVEGAGGRVELQVHAGQPHVFQATPIVGEGARALDRVAEWIVALDPALAR